MDETDRARQTSLEILDAVFERVPWHASEQGFRVRLGDGTIWPGEPVPSPAFTLVLNHPGALRQMFLPPTELRLGEAYIYGDFDVEGDLIAASTLASYFEDLDLGLGDKLSLAWELRSLPNTSAPRVGRQAPVVTGPEHSRQRDRQAISYHYDVSNGFFALGITLSQPQVEFARERIAAADLEDRCWVDDLDYREITPIVSAPAYRLNAY